jgi:hypothetical protein
VVLDETLDLESQNFDLVLSGESIKIIMEALHFSHGFFGGVDASLQEQIIEVNNLLVEQVMEQIPLGAIVEEESTDDDAS